MERTHRRHLALPAGALLLAVAWLGGCADSDPCSDESIRNARATVETLDLRTGTVLWSVDTPWLLGMVQSTNDDAYVAYPYGPRDPGKAEIVIDPRSHKTRFRPSTSVFTPSNSLPAPQATDGVTVELQHENPAPGTTSTQPDVVVAKNAAGDVLWSRPTPRRGSTPAMLVNGGIIIVASNEPLNRTGCFG